MILRRLRCTTHASSTEDWTCHMAPSSCTTIVVDPTIMHNNCSHDTASALASDEVDATSACASSLHVDGTIDVSARAHLQRARETINDQCAAGNFRVLHARVWGDE